MIHLFTKMGNLLSRFHFLRLPLIILAGLLVSTCGGGGSNPPAPSSTAAADFSMSLSPSSLSIQAGQTGAITVNLTRNNGFSSPVAVEVHSPPAGITGSTNITADSGTLTISVSGTVSPGTYTLQVLGVAGTLSHSADVGLTVTAPPVIPTTSPSFHIPAPDGTFTGQVNVTTGLPMAKGVMADPTQWHLETAAGTSVPAQLDIAALWPDSSVRWIHVSHVGDVAPGGSTIYRLMSGAPAAVSNALQITDAETGLTVNTGTTVFVYTKNQFQVAERLFTLQSGGNQYTAVPADTAGFNVWPAIIQPWQVEVQGPIKAVVKVEGDWRDSGNTTLDPLIRWRARLTFWRNSDQVRCEFTLRNLRNYDTPLEPLDHSFHALFIASLSAGGTALLPADQNLGAASEKTFYLELGSGTITNRVLDWDPNADFPVVAPYPVGFPNPAYVAATEAFGPFAAPVTGGSGESQEALDRYEKLMRSMAVRADVETPLCARPGSDSAVAHLALDRGNWMNYGCLQWAANGCPQIYSRNHYDWVLGLYQNALRLGRVELLGLAQIMARHELDLDQYHTIDHGPFYNFMRNWEEGSHASPGNCFGLGRPTHTWNRGYLLHYLWCGERRGLDVVNELVQGTQAYLYEGTGHPWLEREIRFQGWMSEIFFSRFLLDPLTPIDTAEGPKTPSQVLADVLEGIIQLEETDGSHGYVLEPDGAGAITNRVHMLLLRYAAVPMINAYEYCLKGSGHILESRLRACNERIARFLVARTEGGTTTDGTYTPYRFWTYWSLDGSTEGDPEYSWTQDMADITGWLWLQNGEQALLDYARRAFRDFSFFRDGPSAPTVRVATRFGSCVYWDTESKLNGWFLRGGQWFLKAEKEARSQGK